MAEGASLAARLGRAALWIAAALIGVAVGVGSLLFAIFQGGSSVENGHWRSANGVGGAEASAYVRTGVAVFGLWALPTSEVIYFVAQTDDEGRALTPRCNYIVSGGDLPTRWWSITAYRDFYLIANPQSRYSFASTTIARDDDGDWRVHLNAQGEGENGLPLGTEEGLLMLSLRLYQPHEGVFARRAMLAMPRIERQSCAA